MLEDSGLAERHEEAKHEHRHRERHQPNFQMEADRATDRLHQIVGRRIGQNEGADDRDEECPVHHAAGAVAIRKMAAIGPEYAGGKREQRRHHAGSLDIDAVDVDEVLRQPQRQRDERAEDKEIIKREAPHLDIFQRCKLQPRAGGLLVSLPTCADDRVFVREDPKDNSHQCDDQSPDLGDRLPAIGNQHERREKFRHGGTDVAGAKDAKRCALLARGIEARDVGDPDGKRAARNADKQRRNQEFRVGVRPGQQICGDRCCEHDDRIDAASAILISPDSQHQANQRSAENWRPDQQTELGII